jgi:predicted transcriptional regulator
MKSEKNKLTDKEEEIMLLLWEHGPCSIKELIPHFAEPRPHINTVSSFVRLLEKKGYVAHEPGRYGGFNYFAVKPKSDYRRNAVGRLVSKYFGNCFSMVSQLVEDEQLNAEELRELLDMIEQKK